MWTLIIFLVLGEPDHVTREAFYVVPITFDSEAACDAARWEWWEQERLPPSYSTEWRQDLPGQCERAALTS